MAYPNLIAEMTRRNITAKDIATLIGRSPDTVSNWLKGKGDFPVGKAFVVQAAFFPACTIAYLFASEPIVPAEAMTQIAAQ